MSERMMFLKDKSRGSFSGGIGFVLAAAGSAVGLGNLWRFPYLAAKDGGGLFILVYIVLALTFGFALMSTEIAIGRKTSCSPIKAYEKMDRRFKFLGPVGAAVPAIVFPYYCVIGGWVTKYSAVYLAGKGAEAAASGYFDEFTMSIGQPIIWCMIFLLASTAVVSSGVEKGIERLSKALMPLLILIITAVSIFSLTISDAESGRRATDGFKIYVIPDFSGMSVSRLFEIIMDAMGQMFFSMSIAMGIMITYGSYTKKSTNLVKAVNQIEIFDTAVAFLSGLIMIPAVYTFQGREGLSQAGPELLFVSLPRVFEHMGFAGNIAGALFFLLVLFAALTSSVSIMEAAVSALMDKFGWQRKRASAFTAVFSAFAALAVCLGYNIWRFDFTLPNGMKGKLLDVLDYFANSILMPLTAFFTCILAGWFCGAQKIIDEMTINGEKFSRSGLYKTMIKYVAPIFLILILLSALGVFGNM